MQHTGTTIIPSTEFNLSPAAAKNAAKEGTVFITERGKEAFVLMSMEQFEELSKKDANIVESLSMKHYDGLELDFEIKDMILSHSVDLSDGA